MGIRIGIGRIAIGGTGVWSPVNTETVNYIDGLVTPLSITQQKKIDNLVTSFKLGLGIVNLSDIFDVMYILAGETQESSLRNLVKNAHHCTNVHSTAFAALSGFTGDGANDYLDTNYNPSTEGENFIQDNASLGIYKKNGASLVAGQLGALSTTPFAVVNSFGEYVKIQDTSWYYPIPGGSEKVGMHIINRSAYNFVQYFQNEIRYPKLVVSGEVYNGNLFILALNKAGVPNNFCTGQASFTFAGKSISHAQVITITNIFENYIGASPKSIFTDWALLTRYSGNPILAKGAEAWRSDSADTPYISIENKIGDNYYCLTQVSQGGWIWNDLALFTSKDLINWIPAGVNPVLSAVAATWEHSFLLHPCIINIGGTWTAYYSARDNANKSTVGIATSPDLINWTKYGSNPVFSTETNVFAPCVIKIGELYYLYYYDTPAQSSAPRYATSPDGYTWTDIGDCWETGVKDYDYARSGIDPWVIKRSDGYYEMLYCINGGIPLQTLGYALSPDGINWMKRHSILLTPSGGWEGIWMLGNPVLLYHPDGRKFVYYCGVGKSDPWEDNAGGLAILK